MHPLDKMMLEMQETEPDSEANVKKEVYKYRKHNQILKDLDEQQV